MMPSPRNVAGPPGHAPYAPAPMTLPQQDAIASEILRQTTALAPGKSICPSEVARALGGGGEETWRPLMGPVRQAAIALVKAGELEILRKGKPVPPEEVRGVIRLRRSPGA